MGFPFFLGHEVRAVGIDLDGVVYHGETLIPGARSATEELRHLGLRIFFITNNSARTRKSIQVKLLKLGIQCSEQEVLSSGFAAASLARKLNLGPTLVVGTDDLKEEFKLGGVPLTEDPGKCALVVVGYNPEFHYRDLAQATDALLAGAKLLACNRDRTYPVGTGVVRPGCGPLVAAVEDAAHRKADWVAGKPDPALLKVALQLVDLKPEEMLMIGDTWESDIVMADDVGCPSIFIKDHRAISAKHSLLKFPNQTQVAESLAQARTYLQLRD